MINDVLEERGKRYGSFVEHAEICQALVDIIRSQPNWSSMKPDARQALTVICDKIARMLNGDPDYDDNWTDIVGYATLVLNRIHADERAKKDVNQVKSVIDSKYHTFNDCGFTYEGAQGKYNSNPG